MLNPADDIYESTVSISPVKDIFDQSRTIDIELQPWLCNWSWARKFRSWRWYGVVIVVYAIGLFVASFTDIDSLSEFESNIILVAAVVPTTFLFVCEMTRISRKIVLQYVGSI